jgi:hypothetical protein
VHDGLGRHNLSLPQGNRIKALKVRRDHSKNLEHHTKVSVVSNSRDYHVRCQHDVHQAQHCRIPPPNRSPKTICMDTQNQHGNNCDLVASEYVYIRANTPIFHLNARVLRVMSTPSREFLEFGTGKPERHELLSLLSDC